MNIRPFSPILWKLYPLIASASSFCTLISPAVASAGWVVRCNGPGNYKDFLTS